LTNQSHNHALREELYPHETALEFELGRRAAAALANLDVATRDPIPTPNYMEHRRLVEQMRTVFPGTHFEPTEEFVRSLPIAFQDDEDESKREWHLGCILGGFGGGPNRTLLKVQDLYGHYREFILDQNLVEEPNNPDCLYIPPAEVLYIFLLCCMAGSGGEERAQAGPPRRPKTLVISYRWRNSFEALKNRLSRLGIDCVLDEKKNLQFACAKNHTDFETGHPIDDGKPYSRTTTTNQSGEVESSSS
jgi:hypothetical protein